MDRAAWDERYAGSDLVWSATPNQFLEAEAADLEPGRALDLASGEGRNALWLASLGWRVTAVDFSEAGISTGRRRADDAGVSVDWVVADVVEWVPEPGAYDLAVVAYLQLPDGQLRAALGHAARALGPGGTLVAIGHDRSNLEGGYGGPQDASVLWSADAVVDGVRESGIAFDVDRCGVVERHVATDDGDRTALDTLVRLHRTG